MQKKYCLPQSISPLGLGALTNNIFGDWKVKHPNSHQVHFIYTDVADSRQGLFLNIATSNKMWISDVVNLAPTFGSYEEIESLYCMHGQKDLLSSWASVGAKAI